MSEAKVRERPSGVSQPAVSTTRRSAGATHTGYRREQNEDAYWGDETRGIWVVADGLGGHQAGEIASQTVVEEIQRSSATDRHYEQALRRAHALLIGDENTTTAMGTTAVVVAEDGGYFHIYWVGDSRAYLWTPAQAGQDDTHFPSGTLKQLTVDHSYVQMLVDSGAINQEEAASHPNRHVITRCIGGSTNPSLEIDRASFSWDAGQRLLLCSDGLSNEVSEAEICQVLASNPDNQRASELLVAAALDAGGRDNITVQVISSPDDTSPDSENRNSRTPTQEPESRQFFSVQGTLIARIATLAIIFSLSAFAAWQLLNG
ncbi:PP2C family protein-serine/threonine phosphatase [Microbulbifer hydrolyticus]|uniref:Protein phosphatase n=1 Tax=Microbulbifer hydrolyticus TaxID=48074 RepID=A0A6P1TB00_9GAMM|nr:protein phosphatase 2C domain-containing protein [Microbulbifer hydrolyticus]MBB5210582.1 protein phosphatase [Microbulbifer hydrolyticus]QHQ38951.1 SpoIIE family protein phosphatase [Microbulbifer hydrolyticus]